MDQPEPDRISTVRDAVQSGLRVHAKAERRTRSVQLAEELSSIHSQLESYQRPTVDETADIQAFFSDADRNLQRTRKSAEVVEDSLQIGLGHSKLTRIAMTGAQLNSGVALVIAGHNLLISANELDRAHASAGSIGSIAPQRFHDFYRAICVFIAESVLFTTPINYHIAWKGTRYLNNRFLYSLRHSGFADSVDSLLKGLHRLMLSEVHYAIRGILPTALRAPEELVNYLTSLGTQTLAILREFSSLELTDVPRKAEQIIKEYQVFVENTYNVTTGSIDTGSVVQNVVRQFSGDVDLFQIPSPDHGLNL